MAWSDIITPANLYTKSDGGWLGAVGSALNPSGILTNMASDEQTKAANEALRLQIEEQQRAEGQRTTASREAQGLLQNQGLAGIDYLKDYNNQALGAIDQSTQGGLAALYGGQAQAENAMRGQTGSALGYLDQGYNSATGAIGAGAAQGTRDLLGSQRGAERAINQGLQGTLGELGQGLADSRLTGLYSSNYTPSADYGFRQQQGEQAINRANAARGGRSGGAALKQLSDFNQGLASEDYGTWANRNQAIASGIDNQQMSAANQAASALSGAGNSIAGGRQNTASQLAGLNTNAGSQLSNLASSRGTQAADIQSSLGSGLAGMATNTAGNASNIYGQAAGQKASLLGSTGANLSNLYASNASGQANLLTGQAAGNAQLTQAMLPNYEVPTQYAGQGLAAQGQALNQSGSNAALMALLYGKR